MAQNKKEYLGCTIDADIMKKLKHIAKKEHRSVSNMVELFLMRGVGHRSEQAPTM
ncbi:MAG: DUF6364 family protein [Kiritimatiellales bacterium]